MSYNRTSAYDLSLFETAEETFAETEKRHKKEPKKEKVVKIPEEEIHKIRFRRHNPLKLFCGGAGVLAVAGVIVAIIMGQVQLTELNQKISNAQTELENQQSVYTQTQMAVQSNLSTSGIQEYAENKLGMTKATNAQKEFVTLSDGDKAEITKNGNKDIFTQIAEAISGIWS